MEIWKDIKGYEGLYQVSNLGRVKSLNYKQTKKENVLKCCKNSRGYSLLTLTKNKTVKSYNVHKLVAETFIPNLQNKFCVNHINGIKTDNRVENLEWCTLNENMQHSVRILGNNKSLFTTDNNPSKGKFGKYSCSSKKINQYDKQGNYIKTWDSIIDITRELGINNISTCCRNKRHIKTAGGFIWKYKEVV